MAEVGMKSLSLLPDRCHHQVGCQVVPSALISATDEDIIFVNSKGKTDAYFSIDRHNRTP